MRDLPQVQRRSTVAGAIVLVLGLWGALVPFVGPTFGYGMGGSAAWTWSESHLTLHLLPGVAAAVGAVLLLRGGLVVQYLGAMLATVGGIWFIVGPTLHPLWSHPSMGGMSMGGSALSNALSGIGYHYGTGALITVVGAYAVGALGNSSYRGVRVADRVDRGDLRATADTSRVSVDA